MSKFKVGDRVKVLWSTHGASEYQGKTGTLVDDDGTGYIPLLVKFSEQYDDSAFFDEEELEAVPETPKVGSKFYVSVVTEGRTFDTLEEAVGYAKDRAAAMESTYAVFQPLKAFRVNTEAQEVTLA